MNIFTEIPEIKKHWHEIQHLFIQKNFAPKTTLLLEGDISDYIFFINKGAVRLWNNDDGKDITVQFFLENQVVSSFESFYLKQPSNFSIETIENAQVTLLSRESLALLTTRFPTLNNVITNLVCERFIDYSNFFLSRIKDTPEKRYQDFIENNPALINRVPQHYIASYLGITPVSLSRIKNRK
ncbi:Crp/Fnr family transcriptional regulator [Listeria booriae]|uniref:Crp/Fnr family transcriptional regulator n=1 Tax=Listeria booriae TaxID=1552123 RepID=UPI00162665F0|nr:Crp/Fnr family transcriptional regulator [Listeria booriae]MBC1553079.1 Crp/Fnr family transcriptional regulator [Listeria booriae]MBC2036755.1 Crp/Fnr family transcriptional regulator [Listeria booriae]MBC2160280.1 Crp/Fnr family transcriptional regulator [Listeria booriae]